MEGLFSPSICYSHKENSAVCGISLWNRGDTAWTKYYFVKNLQGDVLAVYQYGSSFTKVAEYTYDSWGNVLTATGALANINPFRYRSYYRDADTGFYYLQSRYYDPAIGRFINADSLASTGQDFLGCNMFAYCNNNPIIAANPDGKWLNIVIGAVVGAAINVGVALAENKPIDEIIVSGICGAASGGLTAAGFGAVAGAVTSFVDSAYGNIKKVVNGNATVSEAIFGTMVDTALGTAFGAMGSGSAADIAKGAQIGNAGLKGAKTLLSRSVHPLVKKTAKKAVRAALKYTRYTLVTEFISSAVTAGISKGTSAFAGKVCKNYISAF